MSETIQHQTALITGASQGLGLALARELARQGWHLIIDARGVEALEAAHTELSSFTSVTAIPGDVTDPAHRLALTAAVRRVGGLDLLVNNAGLLGPSPQPNLLYYPLEVLAEVYRVNVIAPLGLIQALRADLKPGATIINVTSDAAVEPYPGWGGYGSSKAAFEQLSAVLAAENSDWRVYWVDPGDMRTQMHQDAFPGEDISDRPLPETSVPGLLQLITGHFPNGRYQARSLPAKAKAQPVQELRVALTVPDFEQAVRLYQHGFGLPVVMQWDNPDGRGVVLDAGRATLELIDQAQAATIDRIEVGERVSGPVRLALEVANVEEMGRALHEAGANALHEPVHTPWGDFNLRMQAPDGMQLTLFQKDEQDS